jgi:hypothetical protein
LAEGPTLAENVAFNTVEGSFVTSASLGHAEGLLLAMNPEAQNNLYAIL